MHTSRIPNIQRTEIGCGVAHGYWKVREGTSALLGGGRGVCPACLKLRKLADCSWVLSESGLRLTLVLLWR